MVKTRIDGQPIAFSGQTASYPAGIQNTINENIFTDTDLRVITAANPNPPATSATPDYFYDNLGTGSLPRRNIMNQADRIVEVNVSGGVYSPNL